MMPLLTLTLLAAPHLIDVPPPAPLQLALSPTRPSVVEMTEAAVTPETTRASAGWSGPQRTQRIVGIALVATGGVLFLASVGLLASTAALPTNTGYPYYTPVPYGQVSAPLLLGGVAVLVGAGLCLGFGIPLLIKSFRHAAEAPPPPPPAPPKHKGVSV